MMKISYTVNKYVETNSVSFEQYTYQKQAARWHNTVLHATENMTWTAVNSSAGCGAQLPLVTERLYGSQFPQSKNSLNRGRY
jgi:hypothetical protein